MVSHYDQWNTVYITLFSKWKSFKMNLEKIYMNTKTVS